MGQVKLRWVYDKAFERFPAVMAIMPWEVFEQLVDNALKWMEQQLEANPAIKAYVES